MGYDKKGSGAKDVKLFIKCRRDGGAWSKSG